MAFSVVFLASFLSFSAIALACTVWGGSKDGSSKTLSVGTASLSVYFLSWALAKSSFKYGRNLHLESSRPLLTLWQTSICFFKLLW